VRHADFILDKASRETGGVDSQPPDNAATVAHRPVPVDRVCLGRAVGKGTGATF